MTTEPPTGNRFARYALGVYYGSPGFLGALLGGLWAASSLAGVWLGLKWGSLGIASLMLLFSAAGVAIARGSWRGVIRGYRIATGQEVVPPAGARPWAVTAGVLVCLWIALQFVRVASRGLLMNHEGTGLGNMGTIRSALSIYYGDTDGKYPPDLQSLVASGHIASIPKSKPSWHHPDSANVQVMTNDDYLARRFSDAGGWAYVIGGTTRTFDGTVVVNCTHLRTTTGKAWTEY